MNWKTLKGLKKNSGRGKGPDARDISPNSTKKGILWRKKSEDWKDGQEVSKGCSLGCLPNLAVQKYELSSCSWSAEWFCFSLPSKSTQRSFCKVMHGDVLLKPQRAEQKTTELYLKHYFQKTNKQKKMKKEKWKQITVNKWWKFVGPLKLLCVPQEEPAPHFGNHFSST